MIFTSAIKRGPLSINIKGSVLFMFFAQRGMARKIKMTLNPLIAIRGFPAVVHRRENGDER
jgi:hypothetical protein